MKAWDLLGQTRGPPRLIRPRQSRTITLSIGQCTWRPPLFALALEEPELPERVYQSGYFPEVLSISIGTPSSKLTSVPVLYRTSVNWFRVRVLGRPTPGQVPTGAFLQSVADTTEAAAFRQWECVPPAVPRSFAPDAAHRARCRIDRPGGDACRTGHAAGRGRARGHRLRLRGTADGDCLRHAGPAGAVS